MVVVVLVVAIVVLVLFTSVAQHLPGEFGHLWWRVDGPSIGAARRLLLLLLQVDIVGRGRRLGDGNTTTS